MLDKFVAIGFLAISVWQFFVTYRQFRLLKTKGNKETSAFSPLGLWFSALFGLLMLLLAIHILTGSL